MIPIVFATAGDPVGTGIVASLARPAGNVTGLSSQLTARLPTMHLVREYVEAGGLMSYGPNWPDMWRQAADLVDRILHGTKPAAIPVQQPTRFDLVLNLKTAKALGLTFPDKLLALADEVIE